MKLTLWRSDRHSASNFGKTQAQATCGKLRKAQKTQGSVPLIKVDQIVSQAYLARPEIFMVLLDPEPTPFMLVDNRAKVSLSLA